MYVCYSSCLCYVSEIAQKGGQKTRFPSAQYISTVKYQEYHYSCSACIFKFPAMALKTYFVSILKPYCNAGMQFNWPTDLCSQLLKLISSYQKSLLLLKDYALKYFRLLSTFISDFSVLKTINKRKISSNSKNAGMLCKMSIEENSMI